MQNLKENIVQAELLPSNELWALVNETLAYFNPITITWIHAGADRIRNDLTG